MRRYWFQNDEGIVRIVVAESVQLARTMLPWQSRRTADGLLLVGGPDVWTLFRSEQAELTPGSE